MPKGIPPAGFRSTKKYKVKSLQELEQDIANKAPYIVEELEKLTKPFPCPHCGNEIRMIDKDVGMYLVDRALGKPKQKQEIDVTGTIARQLTAAEIDEIIAEVAESNPRFALAWKIALETFAPACPVVYWYRIGTSSEREPSDHFRGSSISCKRSI